MSDPAFLADEMLGRLARYLRMAGYDTEYVRGATDAQLAERAVRDERTLITRDRRLAASVPGSLLLTSTSLADQVRTVRAAISGFRCRVTFDRCTVCNASLTLVRLEHGLSPAPEVPRSIVEKSIPLYRCSNCSKFYWEGSHTRRIREQFAEWEGSTS